MNKGTWILCVLGLAVVSTGIPSADAKGGIGFSTSFQKPGNGPKPPTPGKPSFTNCNGSKPGYGAGFLGNSQGIGQNWGGGANNFCFKGLGGYGGVCVPKPPVCQPKPPVCPPKPPVCDHKPPKCNNGGNNNGNSNNNGNNNGNTNNNSNALNSTNNNTLNNNVTNNITNANTSTNANTNTSAAASSSNNTNNNALGFPILSTP